MTSVCTVHIIHAFIGVFDVPSDDALSLYLACGILGDRGAGSFTELNEKP